MMIALTVDGFSQPHLLDQKVTLSFEAVSLEYLLDHIKSNYEINLSYSADNIPLNKTVNIKAFNLPLLLFIKKLCNNVGLSYQVIGDHIVLREILRYKITSSNTGQEIADTIGTNSNVDPKHAFISGKAVETIQPIGELGVPEKAFSTGSTSKIATTIRPLNRLFLDAPRRKRINIAIGLMASYDHFKINFRERANTAQEYFPERNFSLGLSCAFFPGKRVSATMDVLFSTKNFYLDYNYKVNNLDDPFPFPAKTTVCLSYMEFPVDINYRVFKKGNVSFYFSAGFTAEFMAQQTESTGFLNAREKTTEYFVHENNQFLCGGTLGVKVWYNVGKSFSLFLKPDYVYYFTPINKLIMESNPELLKVKTGVSWLLKNEMKIKL